MWRDIRPYCENFFSSLQAYLQLSWKFRLARHLIYLIWSIRTIFLTAIICHTWDCSNITMGSFKYSVVLEIKPAKWWNHCCRCTLISDFGSFSISSLPHNEYCSLRLPVSWDSHFKQGSWGGKPTGKISRG